MKDVFRKAINQEIESYSMQGYATVNNAIILLADENMNAAMGIIELYEKYLKKKRHIITKDIHHL